MSDDLIKRSDAIDAFVEETNGVNVEEAIKVVDAYLRIRECDEVWDSIRAIRDCLECAKEDIAEFIPSADRPQGEWVATDDTDEWYGPTYKCNICGSEVIGGRDNYCYNCGARMKGADDE